MAPKYQVKILVPGGKDCARMFFSFSAALLWARDMARQFPGQVKVTDRNGEIEWERRGR